MSKDTMLIDGAEWIRADKVKVPASNFDGMNYVVVRSRDAGCHAGYLKRKIGANVTLVKSRRLWYWDGANTLSQLSQEGIKKPENCKFPCEVEEIEIIGACEIIQTTEAARQSIASVKVWEQR